MKNTGSNSIRRIIGNAGWMTFGSVFNMMLSLLVTVKVVNYYGQDEYGSYQYALSIIALLDIVAYFIDSRVVKKEYDLYDPNHVVYTATIGRLYLSIISAVIGIVFVIVYNGTREFSFMFIILLLNAITGSLQFGASNRFAYILKSKKLVLASTITGTVSYALQLTAVYLKLSVVALPAISLITTIMTTAIISLQYKNEFGAEFNHRFFDRELFESMVRESTPLAIAASAGIIYSRCDSVMIGSMLTMAEVSIYAIATKLIKIVRLPLGPLTESVYPKLIEMYRTDKNKYEKTYIRITSMFTWLYIAGVLFSFLILPFAFKLIKKEYLASLSVYRIYVLGSFFTYNAALRAGHFTLIKRGIILTYSQIASAIVNVILNWVLIKNLGLNGAAIATVITEFLSLSVSNLFFKKDGREVFKWQIMALNPLEMLPNYRK